MARVTGCALESGELAASSIQGLASGPQVAFFNLAFSPEVPGTRTLIEGQCFRVRRRVVGFLKQVEREGVTKDGAVQSDHVLILIPDLQGAWLDKLPCRLLALPGHPASPKAIRATGYEGHPTTQGNLPMYVLCKFREHI